MMFFMKSAHSGAQWTCDTTLIVFGTKSYKNLSPQSHNIYTKRNRARLPYAFTTVIHKSLLSTSHRSPSYQLALYSTHARFYPAGRYIAIVLNVLPDLDDWDEEDLHHIGTSLSQSLQSINNPLCYLRS